jgi:arginyl-tRNA--protein-N-Asp/Glu arginylyltransferase
MAYKRRFRPLEGLFGAEWRRLPEEANAPAVETISLSS